VPRYHKDPEHRRVAELINVAVTQARREQAKGGWITYLIRDPTKPDKKGSHAGTPVYVGQSKEFGTRVRSHFMNCEKAAGSKDCIEKRLADLLHVGVVAKFEVLDRAETRLASLVSETNWARECIGRGYDIANRWPLQRAYGPPIATRDVPVGWIWQFTLQEAIEDEVQLGLCCKRCGLDLHIDLQYFLKAQSPPKELYEIKASSFWKQEPCPGCGQFGGRSIKLQYG